MSEPEARAEDADLEARAEEAEQEEYDSAAHRRTWVSAKVASAARRRASRVGQRCTHPFGERTELLHLWVDSFNESQNGFRCEAPVGGMFLTILTHFEFESSNTAFIGDSVPRAAVGHGTSANADVPPPALATIWHEACEEGTNMSSHAREVDGMEVM
jgi:hypothetical protein